MNTEAKFQELLSLDDDWDSYGAKRIDPCCIQDAREALRGGSFPATSPTAIVPTIDGGVQVEWHMPTYDLEIEFTPGGETQILVWPKLDSNQSSFDQAVSIYIPSGTKETP